MESRAPHEHAFARLPEELLQDILTRLDQWALRSLNLVSRWAYNSVTPLLWKDVLLTDRLLSLGPQSDQHHDGPLIRKLLLLATKPHLAACVQSLTHRCHLPPPAILGDLEKETFGSHTLSTDPRTIHLLKLAVQYMTNVHTLRLVFGHPTLNNALLRCFFDRSRTACPPRKLWLENCRISSGCALHLLEHQYGLPLHLDFGGLESIRLRRLPLRPGSLVDEYHRGAFNTYARDFAHRNEQALWIQDGTGGLHTTYADWVPTELQARAQQRIWWSNESRGEPSETCSPLERWNSGVHTSDDNLYASLEDCTTTEEQSIVAQGSVLSNLIRAEIAHKGTWLDYEEPDLSHLMEPASRAFTAYRALSFRGSPASYQHSLSPPTVAMSMLRSSCKTLTSLTLDWIFVDPIPQRYWHISSPWIDFFLGLMELRFPHLRAFQFRDAVGSQSQLPEGLFLLDHANVDVDSPLDEERRQRLDLVCLEFMEAHPNLQCLAWPMNRFLSERGPSADITNRVHAVISSLGRNLKDLRIETMYDCRGTRQIERERSTNFADRARRRRFVEDFAPNMYTLESIKLEGGMPRDERREITRALHACRLHKIVMIGISWPVGRTGIQEEDALATYSDTREVERRQRDAIVFHSGRHPEPVGSDFRFEAQYGWPPSPPMIHTIASFHADTVTELKFCGYRGSPDLLHPAPIATPLLSGLKYFHKLRSIILSMTLDCQYEDQFLDDSVIAYWQNSRDSASTALVLLTDDGENGWAQRLKTDYAPDALARRVTAFMGKFLSEEAKGRRYGVHVRASFCLGGSSAIFDLDLRIGKDEMGGNVCLDFEGPREESEPGRTKEKLDRRRWF